VGRIRPLSIPFREEEEKMKREIKFRGKKVQMRGSMDTSETGEFVFGSYVWDGYENFIITDENIEWCVDPETVGQYTGLSDRNGKDIYEGDITKDKRGLVEYVIFGDWSFRVKGETGIYYKHDLYECEVIGNIYEHRHLLEGGYE
jgi:hypothetical protein